MGYRVPARRIGAGHRARQRPGAPDRATARSTRSAPIDGGAAAGRGRAARRGGVAVVRPGQAGVLLRQHLGGQPGAAHDVPTTAGSARCEPILTGIPNAFNHDGGRMIFGPDGWLYVSTGEAGTARARPGQELPRREDPADRPGRQARGGQPRPVVADLDLRPPQRAGARVRPRGQPVGLGVRPGHLGRAQPDQARLQLRLAAGGGQGQRPPPTSPTRRCSGAPTTRPPPASPSSTGGSGSAPCKGERLWRVDVNGKKASDPKAFFIGKYGRLRTVVAAPDGNLWVTTSNRDGRGDPASEDDRILLVRP